ncbi:metallophosphoesterase [bacterium 1XD8-76]|nr:metallophosphoesterase [bacterium 1XD8-76]
MRILIVSDTHRQGENFYRALQETKPVSLVIHCGDVEGQEREFEKAVREVNDCPLIMAAGNNDFFSNLKNDVEVQIGPYKALVTHGHNYYISVSNEFLKQEVRARGYQMVFYGHTHRPVVDDKNGILAVNPGSLSYPRQEGRKPSYALMEIDEEGNTEVTIHYLERF